MKSKLSAEQKAELIKKKEMMRKQPKRRPIWKRTEVDKNKQYVLLLLKNDNNLREFELREYDKRNEKVENSRCVYTTKIIPFDLLWRQDLDGIAETVKLETDKPFNFDSLGNWGTQEELEKFEKEVLERQRDSN